MLRWGFGFDRLLQEVVFRKVLEDDGNRQLVEVEQLGRWRFLMLSGTFSSRVIVEQNRREKSVCASQFHVLQFMRGYCFLRFLHVFDPYTFWCFFL